MPVRISFSVAVALMPALILAGCTCSSMPSRVRPPDVDPSSAAAEAVKQYDKDGDGAVAGKELETAGSLASRLTLIDGNGDKKVTQDEIQAAITDLLGKGVGLTTFQCKVTVKGAPLAGAEVKFVPESFMQGAILPAKGTTDESGIAVIALDSSQLPEAQQHLSNVVQPGFYRVEITHPQTKLPAKYNSASTLGQVISPNSAELAVAEFAL